MGQSPDVSPPAERTLDEYTERYRRAEPDVLYRDLMAGDAETIERAASAWRSVASILASIGQVVRGGLLNVRPHWEGQKFEDFEATVMPIVGRLETLAARAHGMQAGLAMMSTMLTSTQSEAEEPPASDEAYDIEGLYSPYPHWRLDRSEHTWWDEQFGYIPSEAERLRIMARLAQLVGELSFQYAMVERKKWHTSLAEPAPLPPPEQPSGRTPATVQPTAASAPFSGPSVVGSGAVYAGGVVGAGSVRALFGAAPPAPSRDQTHVIDVGSDDDGAGGMTGAFPMAPPIAAATGGVGADAAAGHRRSFTSAETAWSSNPPWTDPNDQQSLPVVGDRRTEA